MKQIKCSKCGCDLFGDGVEWKTSPIGGGKTTTKTICNYCADEMVENPPKSTYLVVDMRKE